MGLCCSTKDPPKVTGQGLKVKPDVWLCFSPTSPTVVTAQV